jgi:hypothetical protein
LGVVASLSVPDDSAQSTTRETDTSFLVPYQSLSEFAAGREARSRGWLPGRGISQAAWQASVTDETVYVDSDRRAFVAEPLITEQQLIVAGPESTTPVAEVPLTDAFLLNSLPGAKRTIYLDFTGYSLVGTLWQTKNNSDPLDDYTDAEMQMPPYDIDGDATDFSDTELQRIIETWSAVAEDYAPFTVNVTTQDPGEAALLRSDANDDVYGSRALITDTENAVSAGCGCQGIAYVGVYNYVTYNTYLGPALNFIAPNFPGKIISDVVSHEVGHNVGLQHDGYDAQGYYLGRDGWAPIMGAGYTQPLVQFSNGSYSFANQFQDDFAAMVSYGLPLRADDHGDSLLNIATLATLGVDFEGVISTDTDVDYFQFTASSTSHDVSVMSPSFSPNLDATVDVLSSTGTLLSTTNPDFIAYDRYTAAGLDASLTISTTPGETYFVAVNGAGYGPGTGTGYSDYGSRGEYRVLIEGTPLPTIEPGTPTISGAGMVGTSLLASAGTWPAGTTLTGQWYRDGAKTGISDSTFSILASDVGKEILYRIAATKSGYTTTGASSSSVTAVVGTITPGRPTISGSPSVGKNLTGSSGTWPSGVALSPQWFRNGIATGDTDSRYSVLVSDVGKAITYRVIATKSGYTQSTANSVAVQAIAGTITPTPAPTITGTAKAKQTLTARTTGWPTGVTFAYQWLRSGAVIGSARSATYKLTSSDVGKKVSVKVTVTKLGYKTVVMTSAATPKVVK